MDRHGFEGFFDTFLFLAILSVASCVVLASIPAFLRSDDFERRDAAITYAASSLDAILTSTLPNASHQGCVGGNVGLANGSTVKDLLLEETYLGWSGLQLYSFAPCNAHVEETARNLVTPAYRFSLTTSVDDGDGRRGIIALGDAVDDVGFSADRRYSVNGAVIAISLTLRWT